MTYSSICCAFLGIQLVRGCLCFDRANSGASIQAASRSGQTSDASCSHSMIEECQTFRNRRFFIENSNLEKILFFSSLVVAQIGGRKGLLDVLVHETTVEIGANGIVDKVLLLLWFLIKKVTKKSTIHRSNLASTVLEHDIIVPTSFDSSCLFLILIQQGISAKIVG